MFDQEIKTQRGIVLGVEIAARPAQNSSLAITALERGKKFNVMKFHEVLGHPSEQTTRRTAEYYGIELTGQFGVCENCGRAKSRQKNTSKDTVVRSKVAGERLFIDISSVKGVSIGGSKYWLAIVDDFTDMTWSMFLKQKSEQVNRIIDFIRDLKVKLNLSVKYIRCDNAGENKSLEKRCLREGFGVQFEYTAPDTPQYNGRVERKFATLYSRVRVILNRSMVPSGLRQKLWAEAAQLATLQEIFSHPRLKPCRRTINFTKRISAIPARSTVW